MGLFIPTVQKRKPQDVSLGMLNIICIVMVLHSGSAAVSVSLRAETEDFLEHHYRTH